MTQVSRPDYDPIQAAQELERRGYQLPPEIRSRLDSLRQTGDIKTPGLLGQGMTIRGGPQGPMSMTAGQLPTKPLPVPIMTSPKPQDYQLHEPFDARLGQRRGGAPLKLESALDPNLPLAETMGRMRTGDLRNPAFRGLDFPAQQAAAENYNRLRSTSMQGLEAGAPPTAVDAERAKAALDSSISGEVRLTAKEQDDLRKTIALRTEEQRKREVAAKARNFSWEGGGALGVAGGVALSAANAASLGIGQKVRSYIDPENIGLEQSLAEQAPVETMAGQLLGSLPGVGGLAKAGTAGAAALAGRLGAGAAGQTAAGLVGGMVAPSPLFGAQAFSEARGQQATLGQAAGAAGGAVLQTPMAVARLLQEGPEGLQQEDWMALAFSTLNLLGVNAAHTEMVAQQHAARLASDPIYRRQVAGEILARELNRDANSGFMAEEGTEVSAPTKEPFPGEITVSAPIRDDFQIQANRGEDANMFGEFGKLMHRDAQAEATRLGLDYNGPQEGASGELYGHLYTDPQTGSTFSVRPDQNVEANLQANRRNFAKGQRRRGVPEPQAEENAARKVMTSQEVADLVPPSQEDGFAIRNAVEKAGDQWEVQEVPLSAFEDIPTENVDLGRARKYSTKSTEAPPVIAVPGERGLILKDGRHRIVAEALRAKRAGQDPASATVKVVVPVKRFNSEALKAEVRVTRDGNAWRVEAIDIEGNRILSERVNAKTAEEAAAKIEEPLKGTPGQFDPAPFGLTESYQKGLTSVHDELMRTDPFYQKAAKRLEELDSLGFGGIHAHRAEVESLMKGMEAKRKALSNMMGRRAPERASSTAETPTPSAEPRYINPNFGESAADVVAKNPKLAPLVDRATALVEQEDSRLSPSARRAQSIGLLMRNMGLSREEATLLRDAARGRNIRFAGGEQQQPAAKQTPAEQKPAAQPAPVEGSARAPAVEPKPVERMTQRQLRAEAKRLGLVQHDNTPGQPKLRARIKAALEAEQKGASRGEEAKTEGLLKPEEGPKPADSMSRRELEDEANRLGVDPNTKTTPGGDWIPGTKGLRSRVRDAQLAEKRSATEKEAPSGQETSDVHEQGPDRTEQGEVGEPREDEVSPPEEVVAEPDEAPAQDLENADDLAPVRNEAQALLDNTKDWTKVKWSGVSDEALMIAASEAPLGSPAKSAIDIQLKARGLSGIGEASARHAMYVGRVKKAFESGGREALPKVLKGIPDDMLAMLAGKWKHGPISKAVRAAAKERGINTSSVVGFPATTKFPQAAPATQTSNVQQWLVAKQRGRIVKDSPHKIIGDLARRLKLAGPGVGGSRTLVRKALGFIRPTPESIRLGSADWMDVYAHEIGHFFHKLMFQGGISKERVGITSKSLPRAWQAELFQLGKNLYGNEVPKAGYEAEGMAELTRLMFTDPVTAHQEAPLAFTELTQKFQTDFPDQYKAMIDFRNRYTLYHQQSAFGKASAYIANRPPWWARVSQSAKEGRLGMDILDKYDAMRTIMFDVTQPMVRLKKSVGWHNKNEIPADRDPHVAALRSSGHGSGDFEMAMKHGPWDPATGRPIEGLRPLNEILSDVKDSLPEFNVYLAVKRAIEKRAQGNEGVFKSLSDKDLADAVSEAEQVYPEFKKAAEDFQKFNEWLIRDYATGMGLITPEQAQKIIAKNLHYITFRKVADTQLGRASAGIKRVVDTGTGIKRFSKFQGEQIEPPMEAFMSSMHGIMNRAQTNRVGQVLTDLFYRDPTNPKVRGVEGIGHWIDKIDRPVEAVRMQGEFVREELKRRLVEQGFDPADVDDTIVDAFGSLIEDENFVMFRPGFRVDKATRQFTVIRDGKPTWWEAKNDRLFSFLEGLGNPAALEGLRKWLSIPRTVLRAGATVLNPAFSIVNLMRDMVQAMIYTEAPGSRGRRARAMMQAIKTGDPGRMFLESGADMSSIFGEYYNSKTKQFDLDRLFGQKHVIKQAIKQNRWDRAFWEIAKSPFYGIAEINRRFEMATRLGEFESVLHKERRRLAEKAFGKSFSEADLEVIKRYYSNKAAIHEAGQAAADITLDFQRGGSLSKMANQYVPFFNAAMIGGDKLARFIKKKPARFIGQMIKWLVIPSIATHWLNRNREEYWNIPQIERDRNWHIPIGEGPDGKQRWIKVPKPYGLGIFSVFADRAMAAMDGLDPVTGHRGDTGATDNWVGSLIDQFRPPYTIPVVMPLYEIMANSSIYFGGPIIRKSEQFGPKSERGAERASQFAYTMGKLMDVEPGYVDYAINSFFGGLGRDANDYLVDPIVRGARAAVGAEPKPERNVSSGLNPEDWYIIRRIMTAEPRSYSETMNRFWNTFEELQNVDGGLRSRREQPKKFMEYFQRHIAEIQAYKQMVPYKSRMDRIFAQIRSTYRSGKPLTDNVYKYHSKLYGQLNETARQALNNYYRLHGGQEAKE